VPTAVVGRPVPEVISIEAEVGVLSDGKPIAPPVVRGANGSVGGGCGEGKALPNKRLKLAGGDRSKGSGVLCPWRGTDYVHHPCAGERVARSLSAIR
jgi:hypothetical protein